ncbi:hypothetical protein [Thermosphaera aggregans]|uniref:Uncharacterized protein n=1 Tax=Thermosphaera aggregans (strain DSM 11486 / M11TL) TaxID=633148 RepID=D5U1K9_THEAM|nr:hypothetical protein [Thermosphaera aggregans]ADG91009.1 hypothetical protein Tagg_0736 [Thermosphaera aggregans DSM 11486]
MSCVELAKTIGALLSKKAFNGYNIGRYDSNVAMVFHNHDLKTLLKLEEPQAVFKCDPDNLYLTTLPVFFDSTLSETISTLSALARFISIHKVGRLAVIYEKRSPRNLQVVRIFNKLGNTRVFDLRTTADRVNVAILLEDLLETSEKIKRLRENCLEPKNYEEYQLELEKLAKLLKMIRELLGPGFTEVLEIMGETSEKPGEGLSGEEIIRELIRELIKEETPESGWEATTVFITPSDFNINLEPDFISRVNAVISELEKDKIEVFVFIPSKYSFLRSYLTLPSRFLFLV